MKEKGGEKNSPKLWEGQSDQINMDVLICQPLFDGSVNDEDLFGTSEQRGENVLRLLVIGSLSSLLC